MSQAMDQLLSIMETLRGEKGCDWDKKQTIESLKKYLLEECYEVIDAMEDLGEEHSEKNIAEHKEELGDLLLQIVFQSQIQSEKNNFSFDDVAKGIVDKMLRRHPHIFGDKKSDQEVKGNPFWHEVKEKENHEKGVFDSVSKSQPSLMRAHKLGQKAAGLGFDWSSVKNVWKKVDEELGELKDAIKEEDHKHCEEEFGDLLHALSQLARHIKIDPEIALKKANDKFERRFLKMLGRIGGKEEAKKKSLKDFQKAWNEIKSTHKII